MIRTMTAAAAASRALSVARQSAARQFAAPKSAARQSAAPKSAAPKSAARCNAAFLLAPILLALILASSTPMHAQPRVRAKADTAILFIRSIDASAFPVISSVVKVTTQSGVPVWGMQKSQVRVTENGEPCTVTAFEPLSKNRPINLALVVDNSGSMAVDQDAFVRFLSGRAAAYVTPLDNAKRALGSFIESFDTRKDSIQIIGFSDLVDMSNPFTSDRELLRGAIDGMNAEGITSFYDAVHYGVLQLENKTGLRAVIALTDGEDNNSRHALGDVIALARQYDVPVHVVGLGMITDEPLRRLASATGGTYRYTRKSSSLNAIYRQINQQILSIYRLEYQGEDGSSADSLRSFAFECSGGADGQVFKRKIVQVALPAAAVSGLKDRERTRSLAYIGGGGLLLGGGVVLLFILARRRKNGSAGSEASA